MCVYVLYIFNSHNYVYLETDFFEQVKQVMITAYSFYTPLKALVQMIVSLHSYSVVKKKTHPTKDWQFNHFKGLVLFQGWCNNKI